MVRIRMRVRSAVHLAAVALACLSLTTWNGSDGFAQSNQPAALQQRAEPGPSAYAVLALAKDLVESLHTEYSRAPGETRNEALRLPLRNAVALSIRKAGLESEFGDYAAKAVGAWEFWDPARDRPERRAIRESRAIEAEAKRAFLKGDVAGARRMLSARDCLKIPFIGPCPSTDATVAAWEVEIGGPSVAVRQLEQTDWTGRGGQQIQFAQSVARSLIDAGRANEAFAILSKLRLDRDLDRSRIAKVYWELGAVEDSRMLMREAAAAALDQATRDPMKRLLVAIAGWQRVMGDRDGAIATLDRIPAFGADRLGAYRGALAGRLAWLGRDAQAMSNLDGTDADHVVLGNIAIGQARRGDFAAAFDSVRKLRAIPPPRTQISSTTTSYTDYAPVALASIARIAARAGDAETFARAVALRREMAPGPCVLVVRLTEVPRVLHEDSDTRSLAELARAGKAQFAVNYALSLPDVSKRIEGLGLIAEALAGVPDPDNDPFDFSAINTPM